MDVIGIDLGTRQSQICVRDALGEVIEESRIRTVGLEKYFGKRARSRVIIETCAQSRAVSGWAKASGHEVCVVPSTLVRSLGVGSRGVKNDRKDAQVLSQAHCRMRIPSVHLKSDVAKLRQKMVSLRSGLIQARTHLVNQVRGYFREEMITFGVGHVDTFVKRVQKKVKEIPEVIQGHLQMIEQLNQQVQSFDAQIREQISQDVALQRLQKVPGVGPVVALSFYACIDTPQRFASAHHLESYLGLTPGEKSSGLKRRTTNITKAGNRQMRWLLIQGAHAAMRCKDPHPMVVWAQEIAARRGKQIAVVALARKMAGIMWSMSKHQQFYQAHKTAQGQGMP